MENEDSNDSTEVQIQELASRVSEFRRTNGNKRPRFPQEIRDEVKTLVSAGVKIHTICKATRLSYSGILSWTGRKSKFKPLKVVSARRKPQKKSERSRQKSDAIYNICFSSGAQLSGIGFDDLAILLERGLL